MVLKGSRGTTSSENRKTDRRSFVSHGRLPDDEAIPILQRLSIDFTNSVPAHVQLKDQLKIAYTFGSLRQGDILPSIRDLARQLDVGEAIVRRAYKELRELGMLSTHQRKNVTVNHGLVKPPQAARMAGEAARQSDRVLSWAHDRGLSSISLARFLLQRALEQESLAPSYAFVDASERAACEFAEKIARAWEVKMIGLALDELRALVPEGLNRFTALIVNSYRYEDLLRLMKPVGDGRKRVFPVPVKPSDGLIQRIRRLPSGSAALLVFANEDFPRLGPSSIENYRALVGKKVRIDGMPLEEAPDLEAVAKEGHYRLIVVSVHVWDRLSERVRRLPQLSRTDNEIDPQWLEEVRIAAGIIV